MNHTPKNYREQGMASLMVTTVLILVISLIVVGFSQVARRNQREALDRQLSSQAFYAAEAGINQATAVIQKSVAAEQPIPAKTSCAPDTNYPGTVLSGDGVEVTCLLVEPEVSSLVYDGVTNGASTFVSITAASGGFSDFTVTWRPASPRANATSGCRSAASPAYSLPESSVWPCGHGILRLDMSAMPTSNAEQEAKTIFLYPHAYAGASLHPSDATQHAASTTDVSLVAARCSDNIGGGPGCVAKIVLPSEMSSYYLNMRSLYRDSDVSLDPTLGGAPVRLSGAVEVDVTAKAVDVIKRVRVQISTGKQTGSMHNHAIETSESLCKRFSVAPNYYVADTVAGCPNN